MTDAISSSQVRPLHIALALSGLTITLAGMVPMVTALGVSNILIDAGGIEPGEIEIIHAWDSWAFSPLFISLALLGMTGLGLLVAIVPKHQKAVYAVATCVILVTCLFVTMFVHGWFFHDIHLQ